MMAVKVTYSETPEITLAKAYNSIIDTIIHSSDVVHRLSLADVKGRRVDRRAYEAVQNPKIGLIDEGRRKIGKSHAGDPKPTFVGLLNVDSAAFSHSPPTPFKLKNMEWELDVYGEKNLKDLEGLARTAARHATETAPEYEVTHIKVKLADIKPHKVAGIFSW